jgi:hypothetical protein
MTGPPLRDYDDNNDEEPETDCYFMMPPDDPEDTQPMCYDMGPPDDPANK